MNKYESSKLNTKMPFVHSTKYPEFNGCLHITNPIYSKPNRLKTMLTIAKMPNKNTKVYSRNNDREIICKSVIAQRQTPFKKTYRKFYYGRTVSNINKLIKKPIEKNTMLVINKVNKKERILDKDCAITSVFVHCYDCPLKIMHLNSTVSQSVSKMKRKINSKTCFIGNNYEYENKYPKSDTKKRYKIFKQRNIISEAKVELNELNDVTFCQVYNH